MSETVIKVENLSKRYVLGRDLRPASTKTGRAIQLIKSPFSWLDQQIRGPDSDQILWALKDVSFEVRRGEVVGIIGRNGAGKSTLLRVLSRITEPTKGFAEIKGRVGSLLEVGTGMHPELTGRENIYMNATLLGMSRREVDREFNEIVEFSGIEKFIDTPVKRYSSGMRVRLGFAIAAYLEPDILIVDEVLAVGDVEFQRRCIGKMKSVTGEGRTVLFVSHNMGMIRSLCDRSILLGDGRITDDGKSEDVVSAYLSLWSAASESNGEICWRDDEQALGSEEMRLCSIRLLGTTGKIQDVFEVDKPVLVEVTYQIHVPLRGMRIEFHLMTDDGVVAFASVDQDQRPNTLQPGQYRSGLTIPGGLLNHKKYLVRLQFAIPRVRVLISGQEYLSFACVMGKVQGTYISSSWPGVLAPQLRWSFEKLN